MSGRHRGVPEPHLPLHFSLVNRAWTRRKTERVLAERREIYERGYWDGVEAARQMRRSA